MLYTVLGESISGSTRSYVFRADDGTTMIRVCEGQRAPFVIGLTYSLTEIERLCSQPDEEPRGPVRARA